MNTQPFMWGDKPYYTLNEYCKQTYSFKNYYGAGVYGISDA